MIKTKMDISQTKIIKTRYWQILNKVIINEITNNTKLHTYIFIFKGKDP